MSEQNAEPNAAESTEGVEEPLTEAELDEGQSYVDPNSGAAPQPGGWAGAQAVEEGHGTPNTGFQPTETELSSEGDADEEAPEYSEAERIQAAELETEAVSPDQEGVESEGLAEAEGELDEFTEEETADAMSLETEGVEVAPSDDQVEAEAPVEDAPEDAPADPDSSEGGDYADLLSQNVPDIQAYMDEHPEQRDAIIAAERSGQNRKGVTGDE